MCALSHLNVRVVSFKGACCLLSLLSHLNETCTFTGNFGEGYYPSKRNDIFVKAFKLHFDKRYFAAKTHVTGKIGAAIHAIYYDGANEFFKYADLLKYMESVPLIKAATATLRAHPVDELMAGMRLL